MAKPPGMNYRPRGVWEKIRVLHHRSGDVGCLESAHMSVFGCSRALRPVLGGAPWWSTPAPHYSLNPPGASCPISPLPFSVGLMCAVGAGQTAARLE